MVDGGVEAVVVGAQGLQDVPDDFVFFVVVEYFFRFLVAGDADGQDDVAVFFAGGFAHDAPYGLNDVDLRAAGGEEEDGVQRGHVDAFREAAGVGEDAAFAVRADGFFELGEFVAAQLHVHGAVDVVDGAGQEVRGVALLGADFFDHDLPAFFDGHGVFNGAGEGDGAVHGGGVQLQEVDGGVVGPGGVGVFVVAFFVAVVGDGVDGTDLLFAQAVVAADEFDGVVEVEFSVVGLEFLGEVLFHRVFVDAEDEDFVVGEQVFFHRAGEGQAVELRAVGEQIVHGGDEGVCFGGFAFGGFRVDARGGGHVQAFAPGDEVVVVDVHEAGFVVGAAFGSQGDAGGAVGFVADDEVKFGQGAVFLGFADFVDGLVGGEDDAGVGVFEFEVVAADGPRVCAGGFRQVCGAEVGVFELRGLAV